MLKFNVDGDVRGKTGPVCIKGILQNSKDKILFMFSKPIGILDSNEAEVLPILEHLRCSLRFFHGELIVESDSSSNAVA